MSGGEYESRPEGGRRGGSENSGSEARDSVGLLFGGVGGILLKEGMKANSREGAWKPRTHDWEETCKWTPPFTWLYFENVNFYKCQGEAGLWVWDHGAISLLGASLTGFCLDCGKFMPPTGADPRPRLQQEHLDNKTVGCKTGASRRGQGLKGGT